MSIEPILSPGAVEAPGSSAPAKRSPVEGVKENSRQLRGTIGDELAQPSDHFSDANKQLLKFHGTYQQDDRDARKDRRKEGSGKHYMFMVRCKIPGGKVSASQYLALDELAGSHGNGTLRITSRQGIQFHGVLKDHLRDTIHGINECLLTTLGACGDVERNVMAPPALNYQSAVHAQLQHTADLLATHLAPRTRAYHEIWLDGQRVNGQGEPYSLPDGDPSGSEPLYGKVYLPRKFKTGLALPDDNSVDIYAQDLGFLADVQQQKIVGYNVLVGGGMGMTHNNAATFPFLARPICYIAPEQVLLAAEAVVRLFRDHGNRGDRKRARIKYLVHDWGVERFRQVLADYLPFPLQLPRPIEVHGFPLHLGWHAQGDGQFYYGISVENGRIKDEGTLQLRTALRTLVQKHQPRVRLTPMQDILLCDLPAGCRTDLERTLVDHGVPLPEHLTPLRTLSLACPAIPTCGLALSEAERVLPGVIAQLEADLARLGLAAENISIRMTGCPNGCVRPYQSDIGIVGRSGDKYTVFVGGNVVGSRLNFVLRDLVPVNEIPTLLFPLFQSFKAHRQSGEGFGDYCQRLGSNQIQGALPAGIGKDPHESAPDKD
jgi:sulfite reductase (ferredoxin)